MQQISSEKSSRAKAQYLQYNFSRFVKPGSSVLEIGPGLGEFLQFIFKSSPKNVDVIDRDQATLTSLKSKFQLGQALEVSAEEIPSIQDKLSKYDLIFMLQIMEHVQTEALVPLIKTLFSCLKPGGHLLITVPNGGNPLGLVERYSDITHVNLFTTNSLLQLAKFAEIKDADISVQGYRIPAVSLVNIIRIAMQSTLHFIYKIVFIINGGVYFSPLSPNITLVVTKKI
jgi:2-polyprenyl-3-methyl-5-hydroxy-6-metoxy-1,4-benzoquinol methylase